MTAKTLLTTGLAIGALAAAGAAGAADRPIVSEQHWVAGTAPVTIPGTGVHKGEWMGSKARLVYRDVTLEPGQKARVTLRATGERRIRGAAITGGDRVGARVDPARYVGRRQVTISLVRSKAAKAGEDVVRVSALTR